MFLLDKSVHPSSDTGVSGTEIPEHSYPKTCSVGSSIEDLRPRLLKIPCTCLVDFQGVGEKIPLNSSKEEIRVSFSGSYPQTASEVVVVLTRPMQSRWPIYNS